MAANTHASLCRSATALLLMAGMPLSAIPFVSLVYALDHLLVLHRKQCRAYSFNCPEPSQWNRVFDSHLRSERQQKSEVWSGYQLQSSAIRVTVNQFHNDIVDEQESIHLSSRVSSYARSFLNLAGWGSKRIFDHFTVGL
jgi:hypothetical protein